MAEEAVLSLRHGSHKRPGPKLHSGLSVYSTGSASIFPLLLGWPFPKSGDTRVKKKHRGHCDLSKI